MSTLQERAAAASVRMQNSNPSNPPEKPLGERKRIPMSVPTLKLQVPEIPGYYLYWFKGSPQRIAQAQNAFFEFVHPSEISLNNVGIGGDASKSGNSDMGDRVSVISGDLGDDNQAVRLYLMKQKMEYYLEDRKILQDRNDGVADALTASYRKGMVGGAAAGELPEDVAARYVGANTQVPKLFQRKPAKK